MEKSTSPRTLPLFCVAILFSSLATSRELPPPVAQDIVSDSYGRVISAAGKHQVACPEQDPGTAVILIIGQSNAANYATRPYSSSHGDRVLNFFAGKCYIASSPLLGADGRWGEYWTELANRLVQSGRYKRVVLVSSAVGGSQIVRWQMGGDLNLMLMNVLTEIRPHYRITHVLWHQGESDFHTSAAAYRESFLSLVQSLRARGVEAPVFVSVTSATPGENLPVVQAQRALPNEKNIFAGVDTDALIGKSDRNVTGHFAESGEKKVIERWFDVLTEDRSQGEQLVGNR